MDDRYLNTGYALAIDSNNPKKLYCGGEISSPPLTIPAVGKSTNAGANWRYSFLSSTNGLVYTLAIHPSNSDIIFGGGYYYDSSNRKLDKLFKSIDGGLHWTESSTESSIVLPKFNNSIYDIDIDPSSSNIVYVGCQSGIFKSTDDGLSWKILNTSFQEVHAIVINPESPLTIFAASRTHGVFTSHDGGQTWSSMNETLPTKQIECLALDPVNNLLFAGSLDGGIFRVDISTEVDPIRTQPILPTRFVMKPNYPNPFNHGTIIGYEIPITSSVILKVFNVSGQLIRILIDENQNPGQYTTFWNGHDEADSPMTTGVYFLVLTAGNYSCTLKTIILR